MTDLSQLCHMKLSEAHLCLDCQSVHNSNSWCPACSSSAILPLTKWVAQLVALPKVEASK